MSPISLVVGILQEATPSIVASNLSVLIQSGCPSLVRAVLVRSCGRIATERWIETQKAILPPCKWQHLTMTMPAVLWPFLRWTEAYLIISGLTKNSPVMSKDLYSLRNISSLSRSKDHSPRFKHINFSKWLVLEKPLVALNIFNTY